MWAVLLNQSWTYTLGAVWINTHRWVRVTKTPHCNAKSKYISWFSGWRIPKDCQAAETQAMGTQAPSGSAHPSSWQGCFLHPKAHTDTVYLHAVITSAFLWSLLWSLSQDKELKHVWERTSKSLQTPMLSLHRNCTSQNRESISSSKHNIWFLTLLFSRPWHSQLQGHWSASTILLTILLLLTLFSQHTPWTMTQEKVSPFVQRCRSG